MKRQKARKGLILLKIRVEVYKKIEKGIKKFKNKNGFKISPSDYISFLLKNKK